MNYKLLRYSVVKLTVMYYYNYSLADRSSRFCERGQPPNVAFFLGEGTN